jgi:phosphatidylinositol glycan class V
MSARSGVGRDHLLNGKGCSICCSIRCGAVRWYGCRHAFFPIYPATVHVIGSALEWVFPQTPRDELLVIAAVGVSNIAFVVAAVGLYTLSVSVLGSEGRAYCSALLFCGTPANVFMSTAYSESLFAAVSFWSLVATVECCGDTVGGATPSTPTMVSVMCAATLLFFAAATRSVGVLNGAVPVWAVVQRVVALALGHTPSVPDLAQVAVCALLTAVTLLPSRLVNVHGHHRFCGGSDMLANQPSWCGESGIYAHVQQTYWNVGLCRYWEFKQLPNFLLATPAIVLCGHCAIAHVRHLFDRPAPLTALVSIAGWRRGRTVLPLSTAPFVAGWVVATTLGVFVINVQVLTRLVAVGCPAAYWYGELVLREYPVGGMATLAIVGVYNMAGPLLHVNSFPWT